MPDRTTVNQSPGGGSLYPFTEETPISGVLDFYLSYRDDACAYVLPATLAISGTVFTVTDFNGEVMASGDADDAKTVVWGTRIVYEWIADTTVMRAVVGTLADGEGLLDARTLNRVPYSVRTIRVGLQTFNADLVFESGFNIDMTGVQTTRTDGTRYVDQINMDAVVGAGMGRQPGCVETEPLVRRINGVLPDDSGNFVVDLDDCFRAQLALELDEEENVYRYAYPEMTTDEAKAALSLYSDCHPCYDCSYFVRTYRGLKRTWDRWKAAAQQAEGVRDLYEANRQRWLDQLQCRLDNPARLVTIPEPSCKGFVGGAFCNISKCCLTPVELRFTLQKYKNGELQEWPEDNVGVQMIEAYMSGSSTDGEVRIVPLVDGQVFRFTLDYANPQQTTMARFRICVTCAGDESLQVTMTAHAPDPDPVPQTSEVCVLPTAAPPDDIQAIWDAKLIVDDTLPRAVIQKMMPFNPIKPVYECEC